MTQPVSVFSDRASKVARHGLIVCGVFLGLLALSAFFLRIEGAVVSPAHVVSSGQNKIVQHPDGGRITRLIVQNGDEVEAGDPLIELDRSPVESEFNIVTYRQLELRVKRARLQSLLNDQDELTFDWIRSGDLEGPMTKIRQTQDKLFAASRSTYLSSRKVLDERIAFLAEEIEALYNQIATVTRQLDAVGQQLTDVRPLVEEQLVAKSREWQLVRDQIATQEQLDSLKVVRVRSNNALSEAQNDLASLISDHREKWTTELEATETELQAIDQSYERLNDQMTRLVLTAPVSGKIHNLKVRNEQAVIRAGDPILEIVPDSAGYDIIARISPADIDEVVFGQQVRLRFDGISTPAAPELEGSVKSISADRLTDQQTGISYFEVTIEVPEAEFESLGGVQSVNGLPATAMLKTKERSLLSYLVQPMEDQMSRAFH